MGIGDPQWGTQGAKGYAAVPLLRIFDVAHIQVSLFIAFASIAIWSSVPLTFRLFLTIKKRRTLYFWSILLCTWGLSLREVGYMLTLLAGNPFWPFGDILAQICWIMMVTGFALVLYSRLNLICESLKVRRAVIYMIIFNAVVWHTFMITLSFGRIKLGMEGKVEEKARWTKVYQPLERIHICFFNGQEILIACLYIRAAYQYLCACSTSDKQVRNAMRLLVGAQIIVVALDLAIIVLDFCGYLMLKLFINSFCYCVRLELEFMVLNQLMEISRLGMAGGGMSLKMWDAEAAAPTGQVTTSAGSDSSGCFSKPKTIESIKSVVEEQM